MIDPREMLPTNQVELSMFQFSKLVELAEWREGKLISQEEYISRTLAVCPELKLYYQNILWVVPR